MKRIIFIIISLIATPGTLLSQTAVPGVLPSQWDPPKRVLLHAQHPDMLAAIEANPNLYDYWHLTSWYFNPKPRRTDNHGNEMFVYDPATFKKNYLERDDKRFLMDINHPWMYRDVILDMENYKLARTSDPEQERYREEYRNIMRMMAAAGKPVAVYGVDSGAALFQRTWNYKRYHQWYYEPEKWGREKYQVYDRKKLAQFEEELEKWKPIHREVLEHFKDEVDAYVVSLYMPYKIPKLDSWQWNSWLFYAKTKIAMAKQFGKPVYAFIQPNYTTTWEPVQLEVWDEWVKQLIENDDCDRIYVFALKHKEQREGWTDIFIKGPKNKKVVNEHELGVEIEVEVK